MRNSSKILAIVFGVILIGFLANAYADCDCGVQTSPYCTGTQVTYNSPTSTQSISFIFDGSYTCGKFANGDYWVVAKGSPATVGITQMTPAWDGDGNGWDINPVRLLTASANDAQKQSFDKQIIRFKAPRALPYAAQADETIIKTTKRRPCTASQIEQNCIMYAAALTVVAAPVASPATAFRPPYNGHYIPLQGRSTPIKPIYRTTDIRWNLIPDLDPSAVTMKHSIAEIRDKYEIIHLDVFEHNKMRWIRPYDAFNRGAGSGEYGGFFSLDTPTHLLRMALNDFDPINDPVARQAVINFIQTGIDYYHLSKDADKVNWGGGGHGQGARTPVFAAAYLLDNAGMIAFLQSPKSAEYFAMEQMVFRSNNTQVTYMDGLTATIPAGMDGFKNNQVVLFGQRWGQPRRKDNADHKGDGDCAKWEPNGQQVDQTCQDPYQYIDGQSNVCNWDGNRTGSNYEKMNFAPIKYAALAAKLFGGESVWSFPESWEYAVRRTHFGYWMTPDYAYLEPKIGTVGTKPTAPRCQGQHGQMKNDNQKNNPGEQPAYMKMATNNVQVGEGMWKAYWDLGVSQPTSIRSFSPSEKVNTMPSLLIHSNPLSTYSRITFTLSQPSYVTLKLFTLHGEEVHTLAAGTYTQGMHQVGLVTDELESGVYLTRLESGQGSVTKEMLLVK